MQILVVDDEPEIREAMREALRMAGHTTASCESADMAVALLPYVDAVICDGLGGSCWSVVDAAVAAGKAICLYTGDDEIQHEASLVCTPCVAKPRDIGELLSALDVAMMEVVR
jgi:CheY-like chemotaxis protein